MDDQRNQQASCPGCLLREMAWEQPLAEVIAALREALPEEQRVDDGLYEERLAICQACEHLYSGTCVQCGCFVEARAMKAWQRCPDTPSKW